MRPRLANRGAPAGRQATARGVSPGYDAQRKKRAPTGRHKNGQIKQTWMNRIISGRFSCEDSATPPGWIFVGRRFRWWRFAYHRLMALKPRLHSGPDRHEALPPPPVINPQSPCFCRITIFYSSELALIRGFFRLARPILKTQPSSSVALATMSGWRMRAVPTRMALAQLGHVRLP